MANNNHTFEDHLPGWLWIPLLIFALQILAGLQLSYEDYMIYLGNERSGALELSQAAIMALAFFLAVQILFHKKLIRFSWLWYWILIAALGSFYVVGEELSWGQHWFRWETSEYWSAINRQNETNLHNNSSWFNQRPRSVLEIGIVVFGIILPLISYFKPNFISEKMLIIIPTMVLMPTAIIVVLSRRSEQVFELLGSSFKLYPRAHEVQEFYYYFFILFYLIVIKQRLNKTKVIQPISKRPF